MTTHCRAEQKCSVNAVNSIEGKNGSGQIQTKDQMRVVTFQMCLFSPYFVKYMIFIT